MSNSPGIVAGNCDMCLIAIGGVKHHIVMGGVLIAAGCGGRLIERI